MHLSGTEWRRRYGNTLAQTRDLEKKADFVFWEKAVGRNFTDAVTQYAGQRFFGGALVRCEENELLDIIAAWGTLHRSLRRRMMLAGFGWWSYFILDDGTQQVGE